MNRRVVITGMGAVTPLGNDVDTFWSNIKEGKVGIDFIKRIDTDHLDVKIGAEVKDFKPEEYIDKKEVRRKDRFEHFAIAAAAQALKDSNIDLDKVDKKRFGVYVWSGVGGLGTMTDDTMKVGENPSRRVSPFYVPMTIINLGAGGIAI